MQIQGTRLVSLDDRILSESQQDSHSGLWYVILFQKHPECIHGVDRSRAEAAGLEKGQKGRH